MIPLMLFKIWVAELEVHMAKTLTDTLLKSLKPDPKKRLEVPDAATDGLYIVVQPTGGKSWAVRYRMDGRPSKYTIGRYPRISLKDARLAASEILDGVARGVDPAAEKRAQIAAAKQASEPDRDTIKVLVQQFHKRHLSQLKSGDHALRFLERSIVAEWGDRKIHDITKRDALDLLDGIVDSGRATTANRVHAHARKFFNWAVERDIIASSPMAAIKAPTKEKPCERYLDESEIAIFWAACSDIGYPWGDLGKVLLLTGARLSEVTQMTDSELQGSEWHLSPDRTKNGLHHVVYLSSAAQGVLDGIERIANPDGYLFTTNGETHVRGFHKGLQRIADRMAQIATERAGEAVEVQHWTFHDLRRTFATSLQRLRVPVAVTEKCINHISGSTAGIVGVYQRHDYQDERRAAFEAMGEYVLRLAAGDVDNLLTFGKAG